MIQKFRFYSKRMNKIGVVISLKPIRNRVYVEWDDALSGTENIDDNGILMQSTGLLDKNDKEIFEGDIVRISMRIGKRTITSIGAVEFDKFEGCFRIQNELGDHYVTMFHVRYFEVIGNIYENPELLEGVEDDTKV